MTIVGTYHMSKRCPKCGGLVAMVPSRRAYGFWCADCGTYWNIRESELTEMCMGWWAERRGKDYWGEHEGADSEHGQAEPVQQ